MSNEMTFETADGRKVIAVDNAEEVGKVKGFIVSTDGRRIDAIHVAGRGKRADVIPWSAVESFGADAVMSSSSGSTHRVDTEHDTMAVKGKISARGAKVLDTDGFEIGVVDDVMFDASSGELTGVLADGIRISSDRFRSLGSYAFVVDAS